MYDAFKLGSNMYFNALVYFVLQTIKTILTNKAAIAINQEYAGNAGDRLINNTSTEVRSAFNQLID